METTDSVYLYSNEQKNLYGKVLDELQHRTCPSTHTVYALMDVEESEIPKSMVNHIATCKECQKMAQLTRSLMESINQLIPDFEYRTPKTLNLNLKTIIQNSEFSLKSKSIGAFRLFLNSSKRTSIDLISVLFSIKMGIVYVTAIAMFYLLKVTFN